jgi:hypothetical protein
VLRATATPTSVNRLATTTRSNNENFKIKKDDADDGNIGKIIFLHINSSDGSKNHKKKFNLIQLIYCLSKSILVFCDK